LNNKVAIENTYSLDMTMTGNYWSTNDPAQIAASIFDYFDNIARGKVTFEPFSAVPIPDAGPRP